MATDTERNKAIDEATRLVTNGMSTNKAAEQIATGYGVTGRTIQSWATKAGRPLGDISAYEAPHVANNASIVRSEMQRLQAQKEALQDDLANLVDMLSETERLHTDTERRRQARALLPRKPSTVYVIQEVGGGAVKIGVAKKVDQRLTAIQANSPRKLVLVATINGGYALEKWLHGRFDAQRLHGEWFEPSGDFVAFLTDPQEWVDSHALF